MVIDGRKIAAKILAKLKRRPKSKKVLVAILIGSDKASESFLKAKQKAAEKIGVLFNLYRLRAGISFNSVKSLIMRLNSDQRVGGIIIQLPLPATFNRVKVIKLLSPHKDVDALKTSKFIDAPTVGVLSKILKEVKFNIHGKTVVVVGRGFLVGRPIAKWLKHYVKNLTIADKSTLDRKTLKKADLVVTGVGNPGLIRGEFIKPKAVLIDFGYAVKNGKVRGDLDFLSCKKSALALTPTPGGTGPLVVAQIFENFFILTKKKNTGRIRA